MYVDPYNQRVVAGTAALLSWQQIGGDGEPVDPGTVTIGVTRADGSVLIAAGTATDGTSTDARTKALTQAQTATLDRLTVSWSASGTVVATTEVDVVAAPWFSNAELRLTETALKDEAKFPSTVIAPARLQVEAFIERCCNRRFVPGYSLDTLPGTCREDLVLRHPDFRRMRSASLHYDLSMSATYTLTADELAAIPPSTAGIATRAEGWNARWVRPGYEHGFTVPPPDLKRQSMRLCREILVNETKGQIPDNATNFQSSELGWSAVLVTPGVRGAHTRLPSVNEAIDAWTFTTIGIA